VEAAHHVGLQWAEGVEFQHRRPYRSRALSCTFRVTLTTDFVVTIMLSISLSYINSLLVIVMLLHHFQWRPLVVTSLYCKTLHKTMEIWISQPFEQKSLISSYNMHLLWRCLLHCYCCQNVYHITCRTESLRHDLCDESRCLVVFSVIHFTLS